MIGHSQTVGGYTILPPPWIVAAYAEKVTRIGLGLEVTYDPHYDSQNDESRRQD